MKFDTQRKWDILMMNIVLGIDDIYPINPNVRIKD